MISDKADSSIVFGTPEPASTPRVTQAASRRQGDARLFVSTTGDLVAPPIVPSRAVTAAVASDKHTKARRSSFVKQRHALAMAARLEAVEEGPGTKGAAGVSQQGNYDGLNYAPMHQNLPKTVSTSTYASQRARKMLQLATSSANQPVADPPSLAGKRPQPTSPYETSFIFGDGAVVEPRRTIRRLVAPPPATSLDAQENDLLGDVLKDIDESNGASEAIRSKFKRQETSFQLKRENIRRRPSKKVVPEHENGDFLEELFGERCVEKPGLGGWKRLMTSEKDCEAGPNKVSEKAVEEEPDETALAGAEEACPMKSNRTPGTEAVDYLNESFFNAAVDDWSEIETLVRFFQMKFNNDL